MCNWNKNRETTEYRDTALPGGFKHQCFMGVLLQVIPTGPHSGGRGDRLYKLYNDLVQYTTTSHLQFLAGHNPCLQSMLTLQPSIFRGSTPNLWGVPDLTVAMFPMPTGSGDWLQCAMREVLHTNSTMNYFYS